ncbi:MAG: hypothetical protein ACLRRG_03105 [Barnesiella sp.]
MKSELLFIFLTGYLMTGIAEAKVKVVAHRGYWNVEGSAQNSIKSLEMADSIKCDTTG